MDAVKVRRCALELLNRVRYVRGQQLLAGLPTGVRCDPACCSGQKALAFLDPELRVYSNAVSASPRVAWYLARTWGTRLMYNGWTFLAELPPELADFVRLFDEGAWPELEEAFVAEAGGAGLLEAA